MLDLATSTRATDSRPNTTVMHTTDELSREFTEFRPRLLSIAYRMLGSAWDAEDVVAEAMVRWLRVDRDQVHEPLAYLTTIVTRLAIDQLRSARATRERYVGAWLPEPVLTAPSPLGPLDTVERREAVSLATLRMMETLSPPERAVLVLHEAFDVPHADIGDILDMTESAARQHLHRARARIQRDADASSPEVHDKSFDRFLTALENGDLAEVQELLAADVVAYSDGGGRVRAARQPIMGAEHVLHFYAALRRHYPVRDIDKVNVNGRTAARLWIGSQHLLLAVDVRDGKIYEIDTILNPDKLGYLQRQLEHQ
jgi:RNA polymerase sigma-70 factor, ECF subfamily